MALSIEWIGHSSFKLKGSKTIYIDPWRIPTKSHDGDIILISHNHHDHFSPFDIKKIAKEPWNVYGPPDVIKELGTGTPLNPGDSIKDSGIRIEAIPAYTIHELFHPKRKKWVGFSIIIDNITIYYAGDTDLIPEMRNLKKVCIALMPVGGKFTMDADEAARAVNFINPSTAIPYHWGSIVGTKQDAEQFAGKCKCRTVIPDPGEVIELSGEYLEVNYRKTGVVKRMYQTWKCRNRKDCVLLR